MTRTTRTILLLAALGASLAVVACSEKKRTEIIVGLATDLAAPIPLAAVHMEVIRYPEMVPVDEKDFPISGSVNNVYGLPGTYAVYSATGTADRVKVILTAKDDADKTLVVRTAVLNLVPGKTLFVRLGVVSACVNKTDCPTGTTCVEGRCTPEEIDTTRLPEYTPGLENVLSCASGTAFANTITKAPLSLAPAPDGGVACDKGTCQEGTCLGPIAGAFTPATGLLEETRSAAFQIGGQLVTLDNGKVLVPGGLGAQGKPVLATAALYDPGSQTFSATGSMATARVYYGEAKLGDGRVLVVGGINEGAAALATAEIYDPATGKFSPTSAPMTVARTFPSVVTLSDGRVLIVGGMNQIQSYALGMVSYFGGLGSAEIYDPKTDTFTATPGSLVDARAYAHIRALPGGGALVACGAAQAGERTSIERFDAQTGLFGAAPLASLPTGAVGCNSYVADLPDGRLLVTMDPNNDVWLFDPATAMFAATPGHLTSPPAQFAAVLADGRALYAGGGAGKDAYVFNPAIGDFAFVAGEMQVARASFMSALLKTGDVLLAGVADATAEIFHPGKAAVAGGGAPSTASALR